MHAAVPEEATRHTSRGGEDPGRRTAYAYAVNDDAPAARPADPPPDADDLDAADAPAVSVAPVPQKKVRVALWDNARFFLIMLVVVGHVISTIRTDGALGYGLYTYVYLFHMPAMILLSGVFSKPEASPKAIRSTIQLLVLWAGWEVFWVVLRLLAEGRAIPDTFMVSPAWTLWFLLSLATMRILLPYVAQLRRPLTVSVVVALIAGLSPAIGAEFSASRTLCLMPFFVAGWMARERGWFARRRFVRPSGPERAAAWCFLAAVAAVFVALPNLRSEWRLDGWLTWKDDYGALLADSPIAGFAPEHFGAVAAVGIAMRLLLLAVAGAMTLALLLVVPRGTSVITTWGSRTLYVYLLHGPIVWAMRRYGAVDAIGELGTPGVLILIGIGIAIVLVLSSTWVSRVFKPLIEPRIDWMFRRG